MLVGSVWTGQEEEDFTNGFFECAPISYTYESESENPDPWSAPWLRDSKEFFWCSEELSSQKNGELFALGEFSGIFFISKKIKSIVKFMITAINVILNLHLSCKKDSIVLLIII